MVESDWDESPDVAGMLKHVSGLWRVCRGIHDCLPLELRQERRPSVLRPDSGASAVLAGAVGVWLRVPDEIVIAVVPELTLY